MNSIIFCPAGCTSCAKAGTYRYIPTSAAFKFIFVTRKAYTYASNTLRSPVNPY